MINLSNKKLSKIYVVLQNRFNEPIVELKKAVDKKIFGKIKFTDLENGLNEQLEMLQLANDEQDQELISEIEKLMGRTDIPDNLGEIGVPLDCVHRIAKKAMVDSATSTNPKKVSLMQMEDLVKTSIIGKRTT